MNGGGGAASGAGPGLLRVFGVGISVLLVLLAVFLAVVGGDEGGDDLAVAEEATRVVSADELEALEDDLGHEVYWAGEPAGKRLELTETSEGSVYVRYVEPGGDPDAGSLTVGTYPVADAEGATRRFGREAGGEIIEGPDGAVVATSPDAPGSAYLAYPGSDLQIEVYDPEPGNALGLVRFGAIEPVGGG